MANKAIQTGDGWVYDSSTDQFTITKNLSNPDEYNKIIADFNAATGKNNGKEAVWAKNAAPQYAGQPHDKSTRILDATVTPNGTIKEEFNTHLSDLGVKNSPTIKNFNVDSTTGNLNIQADQEFLNSKAYKEFENDFNNKFKNKGVALTQQNVEEIANMLAAKEKQYYESDDYIDPSQLYIIQKNLQSAGILDKQNKFFEELGEDNLKDHPTKGRATIESVRQTAKAIKALYNDNVKDDQELFFFDLRGTKKELRDMFQKNGNNDYNFWIGDRKIGGESPYNNFINSLKSDGGITAPKFAAYTNAMLESGLIDRQTLDKFLPSAGMVGWIDDKLSKAVQGLNAGGIITNTAGGLVSGAMDIVDGNRNVIQKDVLGKLDINKLNSFGEARRFYENTYLSEGGDKLFDAGANMIGIMGGIISDSIIAQGLGATTAKAGETLANGNKIAQPIGSGLSKVGELAQAGHINPSNGFGVQYLINSGIDKSVLGGASKVIAKIGTNIVIDSVEDVSKGNLAKLRNQESPFETTFQEYFKNLGDVFNFKNTQGLENWLLKAVAVGGNAKMALGNSGLAGLAPIAKANKATSAGIAKMKLKADNTKLGKAWIKWSKTDTQNAGDKIANYIIANGGDTEIAKNIQQAGRNVRRQAEMNFFSDSAQPIVNNLKFMAIELAKKGGFYENNTLKSVDGTVSRTKFMTDDATTKIYAYSELQQLAAQKNNLLKSGVDETSKRQIKDIDERIALAQERAKDITPEMKQVADLMAVAFEQRVNQGVRSGIFSEERVNATRAAGNYTGRVHAEYFDVNKSYKDNTGTIKFIEEQAGKQRGANLLDENLKNTDNGILLDPLTSLERFEAKMRADGEKAILRGFANTIESFEKAGGTKIGTKVDSLIDGVFKSTTGKTDIGELTQSARDQKLPSDIQIDQEFKTKLQQESLDMFLKDSSEGISYAETKQKIVANYMAMYADQYIKKGMTIGDAYMEVATNPRILEDMVSDVVEATNGVVYGKAMDELMNVFGTKLSEMDYERTPGILLVEQELVKAKSELNKSKRELEVKKAEYLRQAKNDTYDSDLKFKKGVANAKNTYAEVMDRYRKVVGDGEQTTLVVDILDDKVKNNVLGYYDPKTDTINLRALSLDTLNHEFAHKYFNVIDDNLRTTLLESIKSSMGEEELRAKYGKSYGNDIDLMAEEALADKFIQYTKGILNDGDSVRLAKKLNIPDNVIAVFDKILETVKGFIGLKDELKNFFAGIELGEYRDKTSNKSNEIKHLFAGEKAANPDYENGQVMAGNHWGFEIDDSKSKLNAPNRIEDGIKIRGLGNKLYSKTYKLSDVFEHDDLYKQYPQFKDMPIRFYRMGRGDALGQVIHQFGKSTLLIAIDGDHPHSTLLHEIQHVIQDIEGWDKGGNNSIAGINKRFKGANSHVRDIIKKIKAENGGMNRYSAYEMYKRLGGEVQARNVQTRMHMTAEERKATPYYKTQDVADDEQIITTFGKGDVPTTKKNPAPIDVPEPTKAPEPEPEPTIPEGMFKDIENRIKRQERRVRQLETEHQTKIGEQLIQRGYIGGVDKRFKEAVNTMAEHRAKIKRMANRTKEVVQSQKIVRENQAKLKLAEQEYIRLTNIIRDNIFGNKKVDFEEYDKTTKTLFELDDRIAKAFDEQGGIKKGFENQEVFNTFMENIQKNVFQDEYKKLDDSMAESIELYNKLNAEYNKLIDNPPKDVIKKIQQQLNRKTNDSYHLKTRDSLSSKIAEKQKEYINNLIDNNENAEKIEKELASLSEQYAANSISAYKKWASGLSTVKTAHDYLKYSTLSNTEIEAAKAEIRDSIREKAEYMGSLSDSKAQQKQAFETARKELEGLGYKSPTMTIGEGEEKIVINDDLAVEYIENYYKETRQIPNLSAFQKAGVATANMFRYFTTVLPPVAITRNAIKDSIHSTIFGSSAGATEALWKAGTGESALDVIQKNPKRALKHLMTRYEMPENDARLILDQLRSIIDVNSTLAHHIPELTKAELVKATNSKAQNVKALVIDWTSKPADFIENASRVQNGLNAAIMKYQETKNADMAALAGRNAMISSTTDFSIRFKPVRNLARTASYLNSVFASKSSMESMIKYDPIGTAMRFGAFVVTPMVALYAHNNNEDNRKLYQNIPEYVKGTSLIFLGGNNGEHVFIPLPETLYGFAKAFNNIMTGTDKTDTARHTAETLINLAGTFSPISFDGFIEKPRNGENYFDVFMRATGQTIDPFLPNLAGSAYELISGKSLFTGEDVYKNLGDNISSLFGWDIRNKESDMKASQAGYIAIQTFFGQSTDTILNMIDTLMGVEKNKRTGYSIGDTFKRSFNRDIGKNGAVGRRYDLASNEFNTIMTKLFREQESSKKYRESLERQMFTAGDEQTKVSIKSKIDDEANKFGKEVETRLKEWYEKWKDNPEALSFDKKKENRVIELLRGSVELNVGADDTEKAEADEMEQRQYTQVVDKYLNDLSFLPATNQLQYKAAVSRIQGQPFRAAEDAKLLKNIKIGDRTVKQIAREYGDKIFEARKAKNYDLADSLAKEYINKYFTPVVIPLLEKYGSRVLDSNNVAKELSGILHIPNDFTTNKRGRALSAKNKLDYTAGFAKSFLQSLYAKEEENIEYKNIQSDAIVKKAIKDIEKLKSKGDISGAKALSKRAIDRVMSGSMLASEEDFEKLRI